MCGVVPKTRDITKKNTSIDIIRVETIFIGDVPLNFPRNPSPKASTAKNKSSQNERFVWLAMSSLHVATKCKANISVRSGDVADVFGTVSDASLTGPTLTLADRPSDSLHCC